MSEFTPSGYAVEGLYLCNPYEGKPKGTREWTVWMNCDTLEQAERAKAHGMKYAHPKSENFSDLRVVELGRRVIG